MILKFNIKLSEAEENLLLEIHEEEDFNIQLQYGSVLQSRISGYMIKLENEWLIQERTGQAGGGDYNTTILGDLYVKQLTENKNTILK